MSRKAILEKYTKAALSTEPELCCSVDYRKEFKAEELDHIPEEVFERNYGCGVPPALRTLKPGENVLDLGPGLGRDCFIAARKVGPRGRVYGLDMNETMLEQARRFKEKVTARLGFDNIEFLSGRFDVRIPIPDNTVTVIFSNCVNNLAVDKETAYREMFRVLRTGSKLSFSDIVSQDDLPGALVKSERAWADCVAGVLSFRALSDVLYQSGFIGITLHTDYLWKTGPQVIEDYFDGADLDECQRSLVEKVRLYSASVEAFKPVLDPSGACYWKGHFALYRGPGASFQLDSDPEHVFAAGVLKEVCEKTATLLKAEPFASHFTVFEPQGEIEARLCVPGSRCC
ncbi:MAG: methyltransferase domain-containing protein [Acidobacteria bacterium]|nr:methyltransferase domain-containing protein [Acidobacteriota bacterium]